MSVHFTETQYSTVVAPAALTMHLLFTTHNPNLSPPHPLSPPFPFTLWHVSLPPKPLSPLPTPFSFLKYFFHSLQPLPYTLSLPPQLSHAEPLFQISLPLLNTPLSPSPHAYLIDFIYSSYLTLSSPPSSLTLSTHTHPHTPPLTHTHTPPHTPSHTHTHPHTLTHTHPHTLTHTHLHTNTHTLTHTHSHTHTQNARQRDRK